MVGCCCYVLKLFSMAEMETEENRCISACGGFYVGVCMHSCVQERDRESVFCLIRLMRQREAGRFNMPIDPSSPCYTLTFTTIQLRQLKTLQSEREMKRQRSAVRGRRGKHQ